MCMYILRSPYLGNYHIIVTELRFLISGGLECMVVSFRRTLSGGLARVILGCGVGFYGLLGLVIGALMPGRFCKASTINPKP